MPAVEVAAARDILPDIRHPENHIVKIEMLKPELLEPGGVHNGSVFPIVVPAGDSGGLFPEVECFGEFPRPSTGIRNEEIEDRGLSHAGLPDKKRFVMRETGFENRFCFFRL